MKIFAIICLFIILSAIQHFLNWCYRSVKDNDGLVAVIFGTLIGIIITIFAGNVLAHWIVEVNP